MSKLIFMHNPEVIYDCEFSQIGENQIRLNFFESNLPDQDIFLSGCCLVNEWNNKLIQTDRKDYIYLYRTYENEPAVIELCNNNVPYVASIEAEIPDFDQVEPYKPTLDEIKALKISELSKICNQSIVYGVDIEINGKTEHFSYAEEDQTNIKEMFDIVMQTNKPMYYHSDNEGCKLYSVEQIINLYIAEVTNKMHHTTYFNQIKMYIESLNDADVIYSIVYGFELRDEFLETYKNAMLQAKENVETLLQDRLMDE